jgi:hypothetical protein
MNNLVGTIVLCDPANQGAPYSSSWNSGLVPNRVSSFGAPIKNWYFLQAYAISTYTKPQFFSCRAYLATGLPRPLGSVGPFWSPARRAAGHQATPFSAN